MSLTEKLNQVNNRETFLDFVKALIADWESDEVDVNRKKELNLFSPTNDDSEWQNGTIGEFLDAASSWIGDSSNKEGNSEIPSWKTFAKFLYAGRIYE